MNNNPSTGTASKPYTGQSPFITSSFRGWTNTEEKSPEFSKIVEITHPSFRGTKLAMLTKYVLLWIVFDDLKNLETSFCPVIESAWRMVDEENSNLFNERDKQ